MSPTPLNAEERRNRELAASAQYGAPSPAAREFDRARARVFLHDVVAFLRGYRNHLLSFDELMQHVGGLGRMDRGVRDVPLAAIRGSVDRYHDFDLAFLPRHSAQRDRWERVATARDHGLPMPPVELYQLGHVYFVRDGHHRISVARTRGDKTIQARVTEIPTRAPLPADIRPDDVRDILAYGDFVRATGVDQILPGIDLQLSIPQNYARLLRHIALFRYLNLAPGAEPRTWPEATAAWYEQLYAPILKIIDDHGILARFPDRTPTDLYLWLITHVRRLHRHLPAPDELASVEEHLGLYLAPFFSV